MRRQSLFVALALSLTLAACAPRPPAAKPPTIVESWFPFTAGESAFVHSAVAWDRATNTFLLVNKKHMFLTPGGPLQQSPLFLHKLSRMVGVWQLRQVSHLRPPTIFDYAPFVAATADWTGASRFYLATAFDTSAEAGNRVARLLLGPGGSYSVETDPLLSQGVAGARDHLGLSYIRLSGLVASPDGRFLFFALGAMGPSWGRRRPTATILRLDLTELAAPPLKVFDFDTAEVVGRAEECTGLAYDPTGGRYLMTTSLPRHAIGEVRGHLWALKREVLEKPLYQGAPRAGLGPAFLVPPVGVACDDAGRIVVLFSQDNPNIPEGRFTVLENPPFRW